jgi:hypothetical protein
MGVDTTSLLTCTYGGAGFVLSEFEYDEEPIVGDTGRTATKVKLLGKGFIDASDAGTFQTKLAALVAVMRIDGLNFSVTGLGSQTVLTVLGAQAMVGGPFVKFKLLKGDGPLHQKIEFEINAHTIYTGISGPINSYKISTAVSVDQLDTVSQTGTITGAGAAGFFNSTVLPGFTGQYAWPNFITKFEFGVTVDGLTATYTMTAAQLVESLPGDGKDNGAVAGEATTGIDIDENGRKTTKLDARFTIEGDPTAFHQLLRQKIDDPTTIFRESMSYTYIQHLEVTSSFTTITGSEGNLMVHWSQTVRWQKDEPTYEEMTFIGATAIAVQKPATLGRVTQSGSGTVINTMSFLKAPDPLCPLMAEIPEREYQDINKGENQTTWNYQMFATDADGNAVKIDLTALFRPTDLTFA